MLTFIDGIVSYILGANRLYIFRIWRWSFFHTVDIDNISIHLSQPHDSRCQVLYLSLLFQRCWEIVLIGFCYTFPGFQTQVPGYSLESSEIISNHFFSIGFFFHDHSWITGLQGKGEGISLTPHYHFHQLHRHLDTSWAITAESSPLHLGSSWTQTGNLWYSPSIHRSWFYWPSQKRPPPLFETDSHRISWHKLVKEINTSNIFIILLEKFGIGTSTCFFSAFDQRFVDETRFSDK